VCFDGRQFTVTLIALTRQNATLLFLAPPEARPTTALRTQEMSRWSSEVVVIGADDVVRRRGYCDHFVTMCVCVGVCGGMM